MKKKLFITQQILFVITIGYLTAQTSVTAHNPNNTSAAISLDWKDNVPRLRINGVGLGMENGFDIQKYSDISLMRIYDNGSVKFSDNNGATGHVNLQLNDRAYFKYDGTRQATIIGGISGKSIIFETNGAGIERMRITSIGNIGIGTSNPESKLTVKGKIVASEIQVKDVGQIADYVFDEGYNLRSLDEVESFINSNKHLPDVPSAEAFKEKGINMAAMDNLLLQKIEELTLYMIDLKNENSELKKRVEKLEN